MHLILMTSLLQATPVRGHRPHIVNVDQVRTFRRDARGNLEAELLDGARVPVSRAKAQEIRSLGGSATSRFTGISRRAPGRGEGWLVRLLDTMSNILLHCVQ
jgi:hypothetical protein